LSDTGKSMKVPTATGDLEAVDYDAIPPVSIAVGPVLDAIVIA
jgi:hypothetical protein